MKKLTVLVPLFLLTLWAVRAQEDAPISGFSWNISLDAGAIMGQTGSLVYSDDTEEAVWSENDLVSRMVWEMKPLWYAGVKTRVNISRFFVSAAIKVGIPGETGSMVDWDWLAVSTEVDMRKMLTHYSTSTNATKLALFTEARVGWRHRLMGDSSGDLFAALDYNYLAFWAYDTTGLYYDEYPDGSPGGYIWSRKGTAVAYKQLWLIPSVGYQAGGALNRYFNGSVFIKLSPYPILAADDEHILRQLHIEESLSGGFYMNPGFTFTFTPTKRVSFSLTASYSGVWGSRGEAIYSWEPNSVEHGAQAYTEFSNTIGVHWSLWNVGITFNIMPYTMVPAPRAAR
ncbi:MAG: omptin family outer membrane protease [Treponematales bacterium]